MKAAEVQKKTLQSGAPGQHGFDDGYVVVLGGGGLLGDNLIVDAVGGQLFQEAAIARLGLLGMAASKSMMAIFRSLPYLSDRYLAV